MTPARTLFRLVVLSLALGAAAGCKDHPQVDGVYTLDVIEIAQDPCGLMATVGSEGIGTIDLAIHGNEVHGLIALPAFAVEAGLQGRYLSGLETFLISGDAVGVETEIRGVRCEIPLTQVTLEAATSETGSVREEGFTGTLTLAHRVPLQEACACELVTTVQGTLPPRDAQAARAF